MANKITDYVKTLVGKMGINFNKGFLDESMLQGIMSHNSLTDSNILIENIYDTIASEMSQLKFNHSKHSKNKVKELDSDLLYLLNTRPNQLQTGSDLLYTLFYNVIKYGNGLLVPEYDNRGKLIAIESVNIGEYEFGKGYDKRDGAMYLLLKHKTIGATQLYGSSRHTQQNQVEEIIALRYDSIIHIRHKPSKVFNNDLYGGDGFDKLTTLFDSNLTAMLADLGGNNQIKGILYLKGMLGAEKQKVAKKVQFERDFVNSKGKIAVLDDGEDFKVIPEAFKTVSSLDMDNVLKYLYRMFRISPEVVHGTYTDVQYNAFYNAVLEPLITRYIQEINHKLIGEEAYRGGEKIMPMKRLLVGGSLKDITAAVDKFLYFGVASRNQIAEELGFPSVDGGDTHFTNLNAVPLSGASGSGDSGSGQRGRPRADGSPAQAREPKEPAE